VEGASETLAALNAGRVDTLLVHSSTGDRRSAWFGVDAIPVAIDGSSGRRLGITAPRRARLVEVAIRSALGTGATLCFVPRHGSGTPADGIGGLTRFDP
jgi:hypothetical protein